MNKIIRHHFPASRLPEELRGDLPDDAQVTVVVEQEAPASTTLPPTLDDLFARARPSFETQDDVNRHVREMRDEWD